MSPAEVPAPALATLSRGRPWREGWVHERTPDGMRVLAVRSGRDVRLHARPGRAAAGVGRE